jgi:TonB family protein
LLPEGSASFSFFNWLFLDKSLIENNVNQIIAHEKIHSQEKHSIDILLLEFLLIWQWFNPFVYLLKKSVIENHEYLADQGTLFESRRVTEYKLLLLQNILNQSNYALTNNFSYSLIKKRLKMMEKEKSKLRMILTTIGFTMVFALVTISCSNKIEMDKPNIKPVQKVHIQENPTKPDNHGEEVFTMAEIMPEYPGGTSELFKFLGNNLKYPERAKEQNIEGKVYVQFTVDSEGNVVDVVILRGIGGGCDEEAMRVVKLMHKWLPGEQDGKKVSVQYNLPINFKLK